MQSWSLWNSLRQNGYIYQKTQKIDCRRSSLGILFWSILLDYLTETIHTGMVQRNTKGAAMRMCYYDRKDNSLFNRDLQSLKDGLASTGSEPMQKIKSIRWFFFRFWCIPRSKCSTQCHGKNERNKSSDKKNWCWHCQYGPGAFKHRKMKRKQIAFNKMKMVNYLKRIYTISWSPVGRWTKCNIPSSPS